MKAMLDLAQRYGRGPVPVKDIAERQRLSEHYLEQLAATLRRAGLISSVRGASGGYELAKPPSRISVGDIVRVLEGPLTLVECLDHAEGCCDQTTVCMTRSIWKRLRDSMEQVLDSTSLQDVVDEAGMVASPAGLSGVEEVKKPSQSLGCPSGCS